jgi:hypothetical protein
MIDTKILCLGFVIAGLISLNMEVFAQDNGVNMTAENMTETLETETEMEKAAEKDMMAQRNMTSVDANITG